MSGLIAAMVIILFRLCLEFLHIFILGGVGDYSALPSWQLFLLPIFAVLIIIAIAKITGFKHYRLGIPYVIHRFKMFYGRIPFISSVNQFFGGILALASGFVVGKEGPTVHLAAAASHYVGRWFKLPYNSLRILAGCGIAAGIAAAFNTPFAAVIFVMEVVMREYKVHIFVPVLLAAACGSFMTRLVFGDITELSFLSFSNMEYWHFPILIILGMFLGILASQFNKQLMRIMRLCRPLSMVTRLLMAAFITGAFAFFMPSALGAEFINIDAFLRSSPELTAISLLFAAKCILAMIAISLGVPGGIIGAVMVIGILGGVLFLQALQLPLSELGISIDLTQNYALLGLAGFLAAVLHAPMAALSAAMELSSTQQVILPAIITIVSAYVTSKQLCNNRSIFVLQLEYQELPYTTTGIRDLLQDTGVIAIMRCDVEVFENGQDTDMHAFLQDNPNACVANRVTSLAKNSSSEVNGTQTDTSEDDVYEWKLVGLDMSLLENAYPITVQAMHVLSEQNTLAEVYELLYKKRHGGIMIYAYNPSKPNDKNKLSGVITWNMLHTYLLRQQH
jgi:CIC family chloride channel protein